MPAESQTEQEDGTTVAEDGIKRELRQQVADAASVTEQVLQQLQEKAQEHQALQENYAYLEELKEREQQQLAQLAAETVQAAEQRCERAEKDAAAVRGETMTIKTTFEEKVRELQATHDIQIDDAILLQSEMEGELSRREEENLTLLDELRQANEMINQSAATDCATEDHQGKGLGGALRSHFFGHSEDNSRNSNTNNNNSSSEDNPDGTDQGSKMQLFLEQEQSRLPLLPIISGTRPTSEESVRREQKECAFLLQMIFELDRKVDRALHE